MGYKSQWGNMLERSLPRLRIGDVLILYNMPKVMNQIILKHQTLIMLKEQ